MIRTEDGVILNEGDRAYDYYNMKPGKIGRVDRILSGDVDPWFDFHHDDGTRCSLNGSRICSMTYAIKRGWVKEEA